MIPTFSFSAQSPSTDISKPSLLPEHEADVIRDSSRVRGLRDNPRWLQTTSKVQRIDEKVGDLTNSAAIRTRRARDEAGVDDEEHQTLRLVNRHVSIHRPGLLKFPSIGVMDEGVSFLSSPAHCSEMDIFSLLVMDDWRAVSRGGLNDKLLVVWEPNVLGFIDF